MKTLTRNELFPFLMNASIEIKKKKRKEESIDT